MTIDMLYGVTFLIVLAFVAAFWFSPYDLTIDEEDD
ncbi:MAG: hypothetical protein JWN56_2298 [Sphingobacteriales bacterium]|nr:hypothetical protein [Sphingobacteriales bacterium]